MENSESDNDLDNEIFGAEDLFSDDSNDDDKGKHEEAVEDNGTKSKKEKKIGEEPKRRRVQTKRLTLNFNTLNGPNGLRLLKKNFKNFKFKGDNHEKEDLARIIQILRHWMCYQLFPKYSFQNNMAELERLGNKKTVQNLMKKMRLGIDEWGEQKSSNMDDNDALNMIPIVDENSHKDNFDSWWQNEMAKVNSDDDDDYNDNKEENDNLRTQADSIGNSNINEVTATPELMQTQTQITQITLTPEQIERIARNKKLAEERRLQRLARESQTIPDSGTSIN